MEEDLRRERMALLGALLADVVHEMNTPLAAIRSSADTLEDAASLLEQWTAQHGADSQAKELLDIVREALRTHRVACGRLEDLTRNVRVFSRNDDATWQTVPLTSILETALTLTAHAMRGRITVVKEFGAECEIQCRPNQLGQVFINLLINAEQSMEGPGEIRVKTWQDRDKVWISVSDTGSGMAPEIMQKLFQPGFTTKSAGSGTGLGLSISLRIIQAHHGSINVTSEPGAGTTFTVAVPILQG